MHFNWVIFIKNISLKKSNFIYSKPQLFPSFQRLSNFNNELRQSNNIAGALNDEYNWKKLNWCNFFRIAHARVPISCSVSLPIDVCSLLNVQESEKIFHTLINSSLFAVRRRRPIFATIVDEKIWVWRRKKFDWFEIVKLSVFISTERKECKFLCKFWLFWWSNWLKLRMENLIISYRNYGIISIEMFRFIYETLIALDFTTSKVMNQLIYHLNDH